MVNPLFGNFTGDIVYVLWSLQKTFLYMVAEALEISDWLANAFSFEIVNEGQSYPTELVFCWEVLGIEGSPLQSLPHILQGTTPYHSHPQAKIQTYTGWERQM